MRWLPVALAALTLTFTGRAESGTEPGAAHSRPVRVLLLYPSDLLLPASIEQGNITKDAIREAVPGGVEFYEEALDALRLEGSTQESEFVALLIKRYAARPPDLIVFHGPMDGFVTRQRAALWTRVPWMFAGVKEQTAQRADFPKGIPGTTVRFDVTGTVELALRLQPGAKRLVVVAGTADYDRAQVRFVAPFLDVYRGRLAVEYAPEPSVEGLARKLAALPRDSIVLQLTVTRDATERVFVPRQIQSVLASASSVPTFSYFDGGVGSGVVGGSLANWAAQGPMIGKIARELLLGEPRKESLLVHPPVPNLCAVDWRQILRWQIPTQQVPGSCAQLFREPTFWMRYHKQVLLAALVLVTQFALIIGLLIERHRRRQAETEAQHDRNQLAHAARLATVGELSACIAHEINQPLGAILLNAEAGENLIACGRADTGELREILEAIRKDDERASQVIQRLRRLLRREQLEMRLLDLNEAVDGILRLISGVAQRNDVSITTDLDFAIPKVNGDLVQLQQVLLNLIMNAIDALTDGPPERRRLTISTAERPAGHVEVCVSDCGPGIASDRIAKLFEPFFSTKRDGMGLGLSISRSLVSAHGGRIWCESTPAGSTFRFCIPAADKDVGLEHKAQMALPH